MRQAHKLYDQLGTHSVERAVRFLADRQGDNSATLTNTSAATLAVLGATANFIRILERWMPQSLDGVDKDILATEALAYVTTSLRQAVHHGHRINFRDEGLGRAFFSLVSVARVLKEHFVEKMRPGWGPYFLDRWNEFRSVEAIHERYHLFAYLLFTSRGHRAPMHRYPGSPPVILDLTLGMESGFAELECAQFLLAAVTTFGRLGELMREDEDEPDEEPDEDTSAPEPTLASSSGVISLGTIEHAARLAAQCDEPLEEVRRLIRLAVMLREFHLRPALEEVVSGRRKAGDTVKDDYVRDLEVALAQSAGCNDLDQFVEQCRSAFPIARGP